MLTKNLETIVEEFKVPPMETLEGIPYYPRYVPNFPVKFLINVVDFNNYREHSLEGIDSLSKSIVHEGVLEPVALHYDTKKDSWELIAGEGRSWGYYLANADVGPVEIYYDLPPEVVLRMKVGTNSTKTPIDSEDLAKYTKGLYDLIKKYNFEMSGQLAEFVDAGPSIKELSTIIHRSPRTVRNYLVFTNGLHEDLRNYVDNNREKNFYSRSIKIGMTLVNKNYQKMFLSKLLKDEAEREKKEAQRKTYLEKKGEKYAPRSTRLSDYAFKKELKDFAVFVKEPMGEISLKSMTSSHRVGDTLVKHIHSMNPQTKRYIDAFTNIIEQYTEIKEQSQERILSHINLLKTNYEQFMSVLPKQLSDAIIAYMQQPPEKSLRDRVLEQAELRRSNSGAITEANTNNNIMPANGTVISNDVKQIRAIGEKIMYIPVEDIVIDKSQLRSRYKQESIDALVEEIKEYGQMTPGLVRKINAEDGSAKYKIVYGHTRFKAVMLAGKKYYKTFVRDDLTDLEVSMLQSVEDLSESDTPVERAKVLNKQYHLMKLLAEKENRAYDKQDFLNEFKHMGNKKIIKDALEFMELDEHLRNMVATKAISYDASLKIGKLSNEDRLNVLYNVMTSRLKGNELDRYIRKVKGNSAPGNQSLFADVPISYDRILEKFEGESMRPFNYINQYLNTENKQVLSRLLVPQVIVQYAHVYKSILRLEHSMLQKNGHH